MVKSDSEGGVPGVGVGCRCVNDISYLLPELGEQKIYKFERLFPAQVHGTPVMAAISKDEAPTQSCCQSPVSEPATNVPQIATGVVLLITRHRGQMKSKSYTNPSYHNLSCPPHQAPDQRICSTNTSCVVKILDGTVGTSKFCRIVQVCRNCGST